MDQLFYLEECTSTNDEILRFLPHKNSDFVGVYTCKQTKGRGQYGNIWTSCPGQNLSYSLAINSQNNTTSDSLFNYYTAIIIRDFLANLAECSVHIKWPNDIILNNKKVCGMLIEKKKLHEQDYFIIGIGINIFQEKFEAIPNAGSLFTQTGKLFNITEIAHEFHRYLVNCLQALPSEAEIMNVFNKHLYRKEIVSVFEREEKRQNGMIKHADEAGRIWIELEEDGLHSFYHKEIKLLY